MARKSRKGAAPQEAPHGGGMKVWRAALYIRLSVEFNGKKGDSLETQRQIMEAYLALCPEIEIAGVYTDNGISGQTFQREAFQRMLADIDAGKIDCVVVKDLSRLGRSAIDTGYYIEKYFPLHGVRFIAVNDQFDSESADEAGNHITVPLKNLVNEAYAADISKKVRAQARQSMKDGEFIGARPPYGYKKDPNNCHKLLVNEDTAPVVRQIFQWAAEGVALNRIVKRLNEGGVMTPSRYLASVGLLQRERLRGDGKWQTRTVGRMLAERVYTGDMVQGRHTNIGRKQVRADPEDWIIVHDTHEPLVSRELFAKVQEVRERAAAKYTYTEGVPYTENILRGRIFCGHCGKNLHRERRNGGCYVYRCISNERIGGGSCDTTINLRENDLFDTMMTIIRKEAEIVMGNSLRLKQHSGRIAARKAEADREIAELRRDTEKNRAFLAGLYESFVTGVLTRAEYLEMKADYERKIGGAVARVQQLLERQGELERQTERYVSLADRLAAVDKDTALSALLVDQLIERVTVNGPDNVSIQFRFESGFERVMEVLEDE